MKWLLIVTVYILPSSPMDAMLGRAPTGQNYQPMTSYSLEYSSEDSCRMHRLAEEARWQPPQYKATGVCQSYQE
jgi:hypothetical protein